MESSPTRVDVGEGSFDLAGVGGWIEAHLWLFLLFAAIVFVFFIFQKGGFAEKYLEYRTRKEELDAKRLDDMRVIADMLSRRHDRDDPLLPYDDLEQKQ